MKKRTYEFNYGFALLKSFMCFIVVLCHCWSTEVPIYLQPFAYLRPYAVPVFMFLSFYLTQKSFFQKDNTKAMKRVWALFIPQILWAIIYFGVYWTVGILTNRNLVTGISDLFWQVLTGHSPQLNATMWFQFDLIIITVLLHIIFRFCNEKCGIVCILLLSTVCLFLQYSELNYKFFGNMRYELSYPLGRLAETIPFATMGFISSKFNLLELWKNNKRGNLFIAAVLLCLTITLSYWEFLSPQNSFGYAGVWKVLFAYFAAMFAFNLEFDFIGEKGKRVLSFITQYTRGIYCAHRLTAFFVFNIFSLWIGAQRGSFYQCIIIYIVNFIACWLASKLSWKWIKSII